MKMISKCIFFLMALVLIYVFPSEEAVADNPYQSDELTCSPNEIRYSNGFIDPDQISIVEPFYHPVTGKRVDDPNVLQDHYWPVNMEEPVVSSFDERKPIKKYKEGKPILEEKIGIWKSSGKDRIYGEQNCSFGFPCVGGSDLYHVGQDYVFEFKDNTVMQSSGRPIYAINNGIVVFVGKPPNHTDGKIGYLVIIEHYAPAYRYFSFLNDTYEYPAGSHDKSRQYSERMYSYYLHLDTERLKVQTCQAVKRGDIIGYTYNAIECDNCNDPDDYQVRDEKGNIYDYDPHLHFEIWTGLIKNEYPYYCGSKDRYSYCDADGYDDSNQFRKRFLLGYTDPFLFFEQKNKLTLEDIQESPYEESILNLMALEVIHGYPTGKFEPDSQINRAEFTKIALLTAKRAKGLTELPSVRWYKKFSDVDKGDWYENYVIEAYKAGIIDGYPKESYFERASFKPELQINMAEMLKIILVSIFDTSFDEEPWYAPYVNKAEKIGIKPKRNITDEAFIPIDASSVGDIVTRKEAAKALYDAYHSYISGKY